MAGLKVTAIVAVRNDQCARARNDQFGAGTMWLTAKSYFIMRLHF